MKIREYLSLYESDPIVKGIVEILKTSDKTNLQFRGLAGSLDSTVIASVFKATQRPHLIVVEGREEALYLQNDLNGLLEANVVQLFPTSYKRPYQYVETESANVLQRAEVLARLNNKANSVNIVVTYPEALCEKVINKKSLTQNTFSASVGQNLDQQTLVELLNLYDFERTDFVYEPGQFSVRGGIIDVFSYSGDYPFRLDFFGDLLESIRTFNPETQLSIAPVQQFTLVPDVQTKLLTESRESFFKFWPKESLIYFKDLKTTTETFDKAFQKAEEAYQYIQDQGGVVVVLPPDEGWEKVADFKANLKQFSVIEFGLKPSLKDAQTIQFHTKSQPSFNKDFNLLANTLLQHQRDGLTNVICSESPRQLEHLQTIFEEIEPNLKFQPLYLSLREGFEDYSNQIVCYTDHQIFDRFHRYKAKEKFSKNKALTLRDLKSLQPGDYVTHIDNGVGRFVGMEKVEVNGRTQEVIRMVFRDGDYLLVSIHTLHKLSKYQGREGEIPSLSKLGSPEWENKKARVKKKVKDIARDLIRLYAKRKLAPGFKFAPDGYLQAELESSFLYEDTPDQAKATADVKVDMEKPHPMDRLVCGDVGFGKTEVAIRAAFKAVANSKQVAVLVPTTILAMQHYRTFRDRLAHLPCTVDYINRFKGTKETKETLKKVAEGKVDILIGTHGIAGKEVKFKDLGLMIIDEEQKFGVKVKDRLKELKVNVDCLTLSATPIPRTLQFSLMGARDLSIIATPPLNRQPVTTEVHSFKDEIIRDSIRYELQRGGQAFVVHNRVADIEAIANNILRLVPDARVGVAHGQMDGAKLENVMLRFVEGEFDVLVSTNIIESGLDIPNANTILIHNAHMFGLSDLHQMRGRVGRSNRKAFCYLLVPAVVSLTSVARKRLQTLEEFTELGDGFKVAMRDLDIRGAGDILGAEQSGFITDVGFDAYHKILDEAVKELKEDEFKELFAHENQGPNIHLTDCQIETDLEILIPDSYITNISERLSVYAKMDTLKDNSELESFSHELIDRFGPLPKQLIDLTKTVRLRWVAEEIGFEKLMLKDGVIKAWIDASNQDYFQGEMFGKVLSFAQRYSKQVRMKDASKKLILNISNITDIEQAIDLLRDLVGTPEAVPTA